MKKMLFSMVMGVAACAVLPSVSFAAEATGGGAASLCPQEGNDAGPGVVGKLYPQETNVSGPAVAGNYPQEQNVPDPGIAGKLCPQEANEPPPFLEMSGIRIPALSR